jgi:hypothetical protein
MAIITAEPVAAALRPHIARLRIIPPRAIRLHVTPLRRRATAAIRQTRRHPTAALPRPNPPVRAAMVDIEGEAVVAVMEEAAVPGEAAVVMEEAVVPGEAAVVMEAAVVTEEAAVPEEAVLLAAVVPGAAALPAGAGILPEVPRAAARE